MPPTQLDTKRSTSTRAASTSKHSESDESKPYVIGSEIGKGSFATVYKGYHEDTHKQVAVKAVKRDKLSQKLLDNLQSEIDILKSLAHRHITRLLDIVWADRHIYLIIEYCAGGDLTRYIQKRGRIEGLEYVPSPGAAPQYYAHPRVGGLDEIVVRSFLRQLARALKFMRQRNLIHRDIKPQNLLLNPASPEELARGHPLGVPILKIADFGFARFLPSTMMAETLCGSPLYMAPEILKYQKYDAKADLWSVGAVVYEMGTGRPPFRAQNHIELLKKIDRSKAIKFPDEDPRYEGSTDIAVVPPDIKKLIRALLKRDPVERASFEDFFGSTALANSKFPRPSQRPQDASLGASAEGADGRPSVPEAHKIVPPEVLDENVMIPPSKIKFRRGDPDAMDVEQPPDAIPAAVGLVRRPSAPAAAVTTPGTRTATEPRRHVRTLSTEGSFIPGETEEDGILRREYVLVGDTRAVEFNRAVDELSTGPRRPLQDRKILSSPLIDDLANAQDTGIGPSTYNTINANTTFPPPPHPYGTPAPPPPLSSSPSSVASRAATNALNRALSLASKKLFGTGGNATRAQSRPSPSALGDRSQRNSNGSNYTAHRDGASSASSSPRRAMIVEGLEEGRATGIERDPMEDELLESLENLAQKTDVLTHWADEMYDFVKAIPQKPLPDPAKFERREGEGERHATRRKNADVEAEYNAVTCVAVYMLLMSFSQKGIDKLRNYQEHMRMRHPEGFVVGEGFDAALTWFKEHFIKCNDRAALVRTWLPAQYDGPKTWLDQLVYDRALVLSRTAARKELLDQATAPDECLKLYEESLWCLYALQDDLLQTGNPFMDEDHATIATWIKRTKLRLVRCRARMAMDARDRVRDARADQNLVDVARIPPPWETVPANEKVPSSTVNKR
ncbi:hypothetical protein HGRIS_012213 [Hohenbuehelia grisea]|uniref:non-specific serine/threonine protein kinase n=1 Tax=Hohenbuehelia grisea TaxID=104357 RepID=A0ABR3IRK6_9AGAR